MRRCSTTPRRTVSSRPPISTSPARLVSTFVPQAPRAAPGNMYLQSQVHRSGSVPLSDIGWQQGVRRPAMVAGAAAQNHTFHHVIPLSLRTGARRHRPGRVAWPRPRPGAELRPRRAAGIWAALWSARSRRRHCAWQSRCGGDRPAVADRDRHRYVGRSELCAGGIRRLGGGGAKPPVYHRRPAVGGSGRPCGIACRRHGGTARGRFRSHYPESRRPDHADQADAGLAAVAGARAAAGPAGGSGHPESGIRAARTRRLSTRCGSGRHHHAGDDAPRQRGALWGHSVRRTGARAAPALCRNRSGRCGTGQLSAGRRVRPVDRGARCARGRLAHCALCTGRDDRIYGAGRLRRLAAGPWIRRRMVSARRVRRLGALQHRALGLGGAVGMDVDRRCAVGLRAVALRTLGVLRQPLGLGARPGGSAAVLRASRGWLYRRRLDLHPHRRRPGRGVVSAGPARRVPARVSHKPYLRHADQQHNREQHLDAWWRPRPLGQP